MFYTKLAFLFFFFMPLSVHGGNNTILLLEKSHGADISGQMHALIVSKEQWK